jgi:hypothetical protein
MQSGKFALDELEAFIIRPGGPFGYHPKMGCYPKLHNHLLAHMNMDHPSISVYKHGTKDAYLFFRHAPLGNGATTNYGEFVHVSADDMRNKGVGLILADFQEYSQRDPKHGSVIDGFSPEAKKASKFLRAYDQVHVSLQSESVLSLGPVCVTSRSGDSGVVNKQDVSLVSLPCSNEAFFQKLTAAFDKCCYLEGV